MHSNQQKILDNLKLYEHIDIKQQIYEENNIM